MIKLGLINKDNSTIECGKLFTYIMHPLIMILSDSIYHFPGAH